MRMNAGRSAALLAALVCFSAAAEVTIPDLGEPTRTYTASAPTGRSYVTLEVVPGGGTGDKQGTAASWMPASREYEFQPDPGGHVQLTLGITLRWDTLPRAADGSTPQDIRRYFHIGWSTDGTNITWSPGISAYYATGYGGTLEATPVGRWIRIEHQYSFVLPLSDNGKPLRWFIKDERTLNIANYQNQPITPFSVSIDDAIMRVNGQSVTRALGLFDFGQNDLLRNWQFWDGRTTSKQSIVPLP